MQAMRVRRLGDPPSAARLYIDGRRVSRLEWDAQHLGRSIDSVASRTETKRDGRIIVREYHCIRVSQAEEHA